jgi:hypothetical protein
MQTFIATTGHVTIQKMKGKYLIGVIFEHMDESIQKLYTVPGPFKLLTDGVTTRSKTRGGTKLTIRSLKAFSKLYPKITQLAKKDGREGCCQEKGTTHKFCFPPCCTPNPPNYKCMKSLTHLGRISCSCEPRSKLKNILPSV